MHGDTASTTTLSTVNNVPQWPEYLHQSELQVAQPPGIRMTQYPHALDAILLLCMLVEADDLSLLKDFLCGDMGLLRFDSMPDVDTDVADPTTVHDGTQLVSQESVRQCTALNSLCLLVSQDSRLLLILRHQHAQV